MENKIENSGKKKELEIKLKNWFKDKNNLLLLGILIFSVIILLYYFNFTKTQPLWWDEADYMSTAKHFAFGVPFDIDPKRPMLFPFLGFLLYKLGFNELGIKFLIVLMPTWLVVLVTYLFVKEFYDKRIALIASFITSVSWIHIFYAMRLMTDAIGFLFGLLAFFFFWKGHISKGHLEKEKGNYKYYLLVGFFIALSFMIRLTGILYGTVIVIFLFFTENIKFLKNKKIWLIPLAFIITISPFLLWSYSYHGSAFAFFAGYGGTQGVPLGWWMMQLLYDYPEMLFFLLFLVGLITILPIFLILDSIFVSKNEKFHMDLFLLINLLFTLFFFILFLRAGENRWLMMMSLSIFVFSAKGAVFIQDFIKKNMGKTLSICVLILLLLGGAYFELKHTDMIIKAKVDSYLPVKEAGLWMKDNSDKSDVILSRSFPQTTYYSERRVYNFYSFNESEFDKLLAYKPKFLMESIFEQNPPAFIQSEKYQRLMKPVKVWYGDQDQKQPILVIYEFNS